MICRVYFTLKNIDFKYGQVFVEREFLCQKKYLKYLKYFWRCVLANNLIVGQQKYWSVADDLKIPLTKDFKSNRIFIDLIYN